MSAKSQVISMSIEADLLERFDAWVAGKGFRSRSNGFQVLVREKLDAQSLADAQGPAVATVTYVYDHHRRELMERLAHLQHEHLDLVVAATHVHLDHARCLEVLILRGPARLVRALADRLIATRGVERGEVALTSARALTDPGDANEHAHGGPHWHAEAHEHEHGHGPEDEAVSAGGKPDTGNGPKARSKRARRR